MNDPERLARSKNHFELFLLPVRFSIDRNCLESRYIELARMAHPDFAGSDPLKQSRAASLQARINDAYFTLGDDLARARYLLELSGVSIESARVAPEIMQRIFELRESLSLARSSNDEQGASAIRAEVGRWMDELMANIGRRLDEGERGPEITESIASARYIARIKAV